jgi:hypothetical protein
MQITKTRIKELSELFWQLYEPRMNEIDKTILVEICWKELQEKEQFCQKKVVRKYVLMYLFEKLDNV